MRERERFIEREGERERERKADKMRERERETERDRNQVIKLFTLNTQLSNIIFPHLDSLIPNACRLIESV